MAASDYWNAFMQAAKRSSKENAAKQNAARAMVGAPPINYDYNIIDFARDASPVGAAMNMGSALREGDYKTAGLNAALLGAEVLPFGKLAGPLAKRVYNAATDPDYRSVGDVLGNPVSMPAKDLSSAAAPLSKAAQELSEAAKIAGLMKANRDRYDMKEFFNFVANKEPGSSYFHVSKIPNLDKDNYNYLSSKLDFDDAHRGIFPKGATSKEGAFVVDNPESVLALRQQGGQFGPFSDYKNTYIFRANPDKAQPKFQPMKKTKANDPMVMEGYLPKESITSMEKILTAKNLEEFFRRKKK